MKRITVNFGDISVTGQLNGSSTAGKLWDILPVNGITSTWGDEIYFPIPLEADVEDGFGQDVVEIGDVAFWPEGKCFCIFFGATPVSKPGEIRPASTVNVIGKLESDWEILKTIQPDQKVTIEELAD